MALQQEVLKTSAVACVVLLHMLGRCPLPQASVVALVAIQSLSLLGLLLNNITAQPSKEMMFSTQKALPTVAAADVVTGGLRSCAEALLERAAVRNAVWVGLAVLSKQLMRVIGFGTSPLLVIVFACALGAAIQYAASALAKTQVICCAEVCQCGATGTCKTLRCPYQSTFWPSVSCDGKASDDAVPESPLVAMALDTTFTLQLPPIELEAEDVNGDVAQPSKQARMLYTRTPLPTIFAGAVSNGLRSFGKVLLERTAVRNTVWVGLAIIVKQFMQATGCCASPFLVLAFSCALGAAVQYTASALAKSPVSCCGTGCQCSAAGTCKSFRCPYERAFWPSTGCDGEASENVVIESPLAAMALETTSGLRLPAISLETEE